jgi:hypothetical protein
MKQYNLFGLGSKKKKWWHVMWPSRKMQKDAFNERSARPLSYTWVHDKFGVNECVVNKLEITLT